MLLTRVLTALIAGPLLVALVVWGPWWGFPLFTVVLVGLAIHEFYAMARPGAPLWTNLLGIGVGVAISAVWLFLERPDLAAAVATLGTLLIVLAHLTLADDMPKAGPRLFAALGALFYCVFPLTHLGLLHRLEGGWKLVLLVVIFTFSADTGAYFSGRALGRHKFAPRVSPKKTWEGAIGGLVASTVACLLWGHFMMPELGVLHAVVLGVVGGFLGQLGDLGESLVKRSCGVKDSGKLLPGHGGVLDRFDAVSFSAPITFYYYTLVVIGTLSVTG